MGSEQGKSEQELSAWIAAHLSRELNLPLEKIDPRASLARYGLDSLQAVALIADLEDYLGRRLDISVAWDHPTIEALARHLAAPNAPRPGPQPTSSGGVSGRASGMQQAIWMLQRHFPGTYLTGRAFRLTGPLDVKVLQGAIDDVVAHQPLLRTSFHEEAGGLVWREHPQVELPVQVEDAERWSEDQVAQRLVELGNEPFDPSRAPLVRAHLLRRSGSEHLLVLAISHLVFDAWSFFVMMHALNLCVTAREKGERAQLSAVPLPFSGYIEAEQALLQKEGDALEGYWRAQLAGRDHFMPVPTDRPRGGDDALWVRSHGFRLDGASAERLRRLAEANESTLFQVVLAGLALVLRARGGRDQVTFTSSVDVRRPEHRLTIGPFINHVVLVLDASGDPTVGDFLDRVRRSTLGGLTHEAYPFDRVLDQGWVDWKDRVHVPLLQMQCNYYNFKAGAQQSPAFRGSAAALAAPGARFELGSVQVEPVAIPQRKAPFDLSLWVTLAGDELQCRLEYRVARFDAATVERLASELQQVVMQMAEDPSRRLSSLKVSAG